MILGENTEGRLISEPNQNQSFLTTKPSLTSLRADGYQPPNLKSIPFKISTEPDLNNQHQRQVSIPKLKVDRESLMHGVDALNVPDKASIRDPIFEEYRKRGFQDVPIFRAKYVTLENKNDENYPQRIENSRTPNRSQNYIPTTSSNQEYYLDPYAGKENAYVRVTPFDKQPSFYEPANRTFADSSFRSPPKRGEQFPIEPMRRNSPGKRAHFEELLTETSQKAEDFEPARRIITTGSNETERFYPIVKTLVLDYPYLIINTNAKKEPELAPDVFVEKKRKKKDEIDPFLQTLAKTFVVKGEDSTSRRKSRALLKFEQAALLAEKENEEGEGYAGVMKKSKSAEKNRASVREESNPLNLSQISQQESVVLSKKPSFLEDRPSKIFEAKTPNDRPSKIFEAKTPNDRPSKIFEAKTPNEETQKTGLSPEPNKIKSALRPSGSFSNIPDKKKESTVRISIPEKSDRAQEPPKKIEAKQADFLKKLEGMQQRSQRRLTTLISHNEDLSPAPRKSMMGAPGTLTILENEESTTP